MKNLRLIILIMCSVILCLFLSIPSVIAQPNIDITFEPEEPAPESKINFTATVSGENISEVYICLSECKEGLCYADSFNESMDEISEGVYQKDITMIHSDATYIEYWAVVNDNDTWYNFNLDYETANLKTSSNGNGDTTNGNDTDDTPGFEMILVLLSLVVLIFLFKRKR